jgi:carboxyl-terminal processing protease
VINRENQQNLAGQPVDYEYHPKPKKGSRWPRRLLTIAVAVLLFGTGLAVGRGNLQVNGLSKPSVSSQSSDLDYASVNQVYGLLKKDFDGQLDPAKLTDGLKTGLVNAAGDPYTEYFNPQAAKDLNDELSGSFTGIGAELGSNDENNIVVIAPLAGFPAEKAGLQPKDIIAAINGNSTAGMSVSQAVQKIRGKAGTKVTLTVVRGNQTPFDVTITRTEIKIPSVESKVDGKIGYLKVSQFTNDTVELAQKAADDFKAKGVKGVVLDLRSDPGGYLSGAVDISSLWLKPGQVVVQEKRGSTIIDTQKASGNNPLSGLPVVVLINNGSASASEITAGALHDNIAAVLVGQKSFGKGSVQQVENLPNGSELKVTIARWYTPKGKNIDKQGIQPDVVVVMTDVDKKAGRDPQKDKAYQILQTKIQ